MLRAYVCRSYSFALCDIVKGTGEKMSSKFWKEKPLTWQRAVTTVAFILFMGLIAWLTIGPRHIVAECSVNNMDWVQLPDSIEDGPCWVNVETNKSMCVFPGDMQCRFEGDISILGALIMAYGK